MNLSIIIPTLNEAGYLPRTVAAVRRRARLGPPYEMIVADCGSTDGTPAAARQLGLRVVVDTPPPGTRAAALNAGAAHAAGDVLLFLDADTLPPPGYDRAIGHALTNGHVIGGTFEFELDDSALGLRLVEWINRIRYRIWPRYYGDQGLFVRAAVFRQLGGFPPRRILETSDFSRTLALHGRVLLLRQRMRTSARRFLAGGIYRVLRNDAWIWWLDLIGRPTDRFGSSYWGENRRRGE